MKKQENKIINKNYIYMNWILLGLSIYVIFFPILSFYISQFFPVFGKCAYLTLTNKPCPLCGGTRYFANIFQVFQNPSYLSQPFGIIAVAIVFEMVFRIVILIQINKYKVVSKKVIKIDVVIHIIEVIVFIVYEIIFFIT